jgi:Na+/proline symporter
MDWNVAQLTRSVVETDYSRWFNWDWSASNNALKQFVSGIFITIVMTGLDQEMMQKNLSCKDLKSAQKNIYSTSITLVIVNILFLTLGAVMALYVNNRLGGMQGIGLADAMGAFSKAQTDKLFPVIASQYLPLGVGLFFIIGLISASYPSAGGALTSLTTAFCIDFLNFDKRNDLSQNRKDKIRKTVHGGYTVLFFLILLVLYLVNNQAIINLVYLLAAYTYGPLLGFFFFGILTKYRVKDKAAPYIAIAAPVLCYVLDVAFKTWFDFGLGFTILICNGLFTFVGMWLFREQKQELSSL